MDIIFTSRFSCFSVFFGSRVRGDDGAIGGDGAIRDGDAIEGDGAVRDDDAIEGDGVIAIGK
ncbi:hypothetical protein D9M68_638440 [compost metagenome]